MKNIIYFVILILIGCNTPPLTPNELYENYRKSVVLIYNSYFFKTTLDNGLEFYYLFKDDNPIFFNSEEEALENAAVNFGTGFFISEKGEIATNRHVIYPIIDEEIAGKKINDYLSDLKLKIQKAINENENEKGKLFDIWNEYYEILDIEKKSQIRNEFTLRNNDVLELGNMIEKLDFNPKNTKTYIRRKFLGIALDDTFVTDMEDFKECVPLKKSSDKDIDLVIIQLKDKKVPEGVKVVSVLQEQKLNEKIKLNDNIFMVGFNHGISLASTSDGLKSQFTQGTITQEPDYKKILYSIPTLPGSSGSPIFDQWGNLIAINFAKTADFQGFSFGIPSYHLFELYKSNNNNSEEINFDFADRKTKKEDIENKESIYENEIKNLLKAEDQRNFDLVVKYYDLKYLKRYWNYSFPTYQELKDAYNKGWSLTQNSKNEINYIKKEADKIYLVNLDFTFYNPYKKEWKMVNSTVKFVFGDNDKLIEVYGVK